MNGKEELDLIERENAERLESMRASISNGGGQPAANKAFVQGFDRMFYLISMLFKRIDGISQNGGHSPLTLKLPGGASLTGFDVRDFARLGYLGALAYILLKIHSPEVLP